MCALRAQNTPTGLLALAPPMAPSCIVLAERLRCCGCDYSYLHLGLNHGIHELVLALGDLDDFLNQACAKPVLQLRDATHVSYWVRQEHVLLDVRFGSVLGLRFKLDVRQDALVAVVGGTLHLFGVG